MPARLDPRGHAGHAEEGQPYGEERDHAPGAQPEERQAREQDRVVEQDRQRRGPFLWALDCGENALVSGGLFISYRRQDAAAYAGRLHDVLVQRYSERVFFDITDLSPGTDWSTQLQQAVASSELMLVVIGPQWLSATSPSGERRIDDPGDFIRSEIAAALRLNKRVVPVLVAGAMMPHSSELPDDLRGLARRNSVELRDESWDADVERLSRVLDPLMGGAQGAPSTRKTSAAQPFMARLAQAFDVLLGRGTRDVTAPEATPAPPPTPFPAVPRRAASSVGSNTAQPTAPRRHEVFVSYAAEDLRIRR